MSILNFVILQNLMIKSSKNYKFIKLIEFTQNAETNQRPRDDHRRRVGVRHPAKHNRKATL